MRCMPAHGFEPEEQDQRYYTASGGVWQLAGHLSPFCFPHSARLCLTKAVLCYNIRKMSSESLSALPPPQGAEVISHSPDHTLYLGQCLGALLQPGDVLLLLGDIGVGKTHLAKGIVRGTGSPDLVTSPSFVLVNEYRGGPSLQGERMYHLDLYRMEDAAEVTTVGLDDMLDGEGVCLIEWAERAADWLPPEHLAISLRHLDETSRVLRVEPCGERYHRLVEAFRQAVGAGGEAEPC